MLQQNKIISVITFLCCLLFTISDITAQDIHHRNEDLPCVNKNFNVAIHMTVDSTNRPLYNSAQVDTILKKVSDYFSPICISFESCEFNVIENDYSLGRIRNQPILIKDQIKELNNRFAQRRRINIFFVDYIDATFCGDSEFEGIYDAFNASVYIELECNDKPAGQLAHQLGHLFGLLDTYDAESIELVDGSNCATAADGLCDTPADPYGQEYISAEDRELLENKEITNLYIGGDCEFIYEIRDPNGAYYQPDVGNIMSNYPCKCGFSREQLLLIVENYLKSNVQFF